MYLYAIVVIHNFVLGIVYLIKLIKPIKELSKKLELSLRKRCERRAELNQKIGIIDIKG